MDLKPASVWEWQRLVRRAQFTERDAMLIALALATYADPDGTRIWPGVKRLTRVCQRSRATVCRCLSELRALGLIECVESGSATGKKGGSDEYRLTFPADILVTIVMLGPDEDLSTTRAHP